MAFPPRGKVWTQFPSDPALGDQTQQALQWMITQINQLAGQANAPTSQGLQSLVQNTVDPTTGQLISAGNRVASIASAIAFVATPTTVTFYWDGTNGSQPFTIGRDDNSVYHNTAGSPLVVSGLVASTQYFFYPFFNEAQQVIQFATQPGISVGSPSIAFLNPNFKAAQQQILRGNILLAFVLGTNGITTPATGTTPGSGGSGGGGVGGGGNRGNLQFL